MLEENLIKIYETSFRENREMPALTDYFKGETFSYYEMAKEIAKLHLLFKKAGDKEGRQDSADRPQQSSVVHHLHRHDLLRRRNRPDIAGFRPGRHHPHHQPLGKQAALSGRQLLGHHRRRPDTPDRGRVFAHRFPRHLRTQRQGAHQVPARYPEKLPFEISARVQRKRHQVPRDPQRRGHPAQLHVGHHGLFQGSDAHGEQPHGQRASFARGMVNTQTGTHYFRKGGRTLSFLPLAHAYGCAFDFLSPLAVGGPRHPAG